MQGSRNAEAVITEICFQKGKASLLSEMDNKLVVTIFCF